MNSRARLGTSSQRCKAVLKVSKFWCFGDGVERPRITKVIIQPKSGVLYSHSLAWMDSKRFNNAIKDAIKQWICACDGRVSEVKKRLALPSNQRALIDAGGRKAVTSQDLQNWKKLVVAQADNTAVRSSKDTWCAQVDEAIELSEQRGWWAEELSAKRSKSKACPDGVSHGVVFCDDRGLKHLAGEQELCLVDATHNTNALEWFLYTILKRESLGIWRPIAHFLTSHLDSDIQLACLNRLAELYSFSTRTLVSDDSKAEQRAWLSFRHTHGHHDHIHILCQKHFKETLNKQFKGDEYKTTRKFLLQALYTAPSKQDCHHALQQAWNSIPKGGQHDVKRQYIEQSLGLYAVEDTTWQWATWFRYNKPLLLQCLTTSPLEGWHSTLKDGYNKKDLHQKTSLFGIITAALNVDQAWHDKADNARRQSSTT